MHVTVRVALQLASQDAATAVDVVDDSGGVVLATSTRDIEAFPIHAPLSAVTWGTLRQESRASRRGNELIRAAWSNGS